jgi:tRNA nucleotidyltransferase/poly(A) polymerase
MIDRLAVLREPLRSLAAPAWIVGGSLRDALLGRPVVDVDVAVDGDAGDAARALATAHRAGRFRLSDAFGAWRVHGGTLGVTVDITPLQGRDLSTDLARRDLTVNALAAPVSHGEVIDQHGGLADLQAHVLRMVNTEVFRADPVRLARLGRLATQLGFVIDPDTQLRARMDAFAIATSPGERVMEELRRIARTPDAARGFALLDDLGLLGVLIPELEEGRGLEQTPYHHKDVLGHTLEVVEHICAIRSDPAAVFRGVGPRIAGALAEPLADGLTRGDALVFAGLLHDMAKAATYAVTPEGRATFFHHDRQGAVLASEWCARMKTSSVFRDTMALCVRHHLAVGFMVHRQPLSLRQIHRYIEATSGAEVELLVLSVADRLATDGPRTTPVQIERHLAVAREVARWVFALRDRGPTVPLLTGIELSGLLEREPGPWLSEAVAALREEQVVGVVSTRAQAQRFARRWASAHPEG